MRICKRKITKEMYDRAVNGSLSRDDYLKVFDESDRMGYGIYGDKVHEENGEYYVSFEMGDSCD